MKHTDEPCNLHSMIQGTMFSQGYPEETIQDRTNAIMWLAVNVGGPWPFYVEREALGRPLFRGWSFQYDLTLCEYLLATSDARVPPISKIEYDDYVARLS